MLLEPRRRGREQRIEKPAVVAVRLTVDLQRDQCLGRTEERVGTRWRAAHLRPMRDVDDVGHPHQRDGAAVADDRFCLERVQELGLLGFESLPEDVDPAGQARSSLTQSFLLVRESRLISFNGVRSSSVNGEPASRSPPTVAPNG